MLLYQLPAIHLHRTRHSGTAYQIQYGQHAVFADVISYADIGILRGNAKPHDLALADPAQPPILEHAAI